MVWKCPSCGFDQNDESNMVCVCGFRYVPEVSHQDTSWSNSVPLQSDETKDPVNNRNLVAIRASYPFFAAVIILTAFINRSLTFFISYVIPIAIAGFYIYKYKPKKNRPSHDQAISSNPLDISNVVVSDPQFYGNISKIELGILATFTLIIPAAISYLTSKNIERFLSTTFVLGVGGAILAVLAIIVKRSFSRRLLQP